MTLGEKIKLYRLQAGYKSAQKLSDALDGAWSRGQIANYEANLNEPNIHFFDAFRKLTGFNLSDSLTELGNRGDLSVSEPSGESYGGHTILRLLSRLELQSDIDQGTREVIAQEVRSLLSELKNEKLKNEKLKSQLIKALDIYESTKAQIKRSV